MLQLLLSQLLLDLQFAEYLFPLLCGQAHLGSLALLLLHLSGHALVHFLNALLLDP